jgi:hypothetical protein
VGSSPIENRSYESTNCKRSKQGAGRKGPIYFLGAIQLLASWTQHRGSQSRMKVRKVHVVAHQLDHIDLIGSKSFTVQSSPGSDTFDTCMLLADIAGWTFHIEAASRPSQGQGLLPHLVQPVDCVHFQSAWESSSEELSAFVYASVRLFRLPHLGGDERTD